MAARRSGKSAAKVAQQNEEKTLKAASTSDSFQNFLFNLGIGTDNPTSASTYGFNPITRVHTLLEWIHRGSWIGGIAVDVVADDMTRGGVDFLSTMPPDDAEQLQGAIQRLGVWDSVNDTVKWSRLFGGAIGVPLIDGQDMTTPLRIDRVGRKQFKGMFVLDRWMVEPSLNNLVKDFGPSLGMPKFYRVTAEAPALPMMTVHYSRCMRLEGIRLPYWQRIAENLWGLSVLERLYDRMVAFDSATTGAAQLVYKAYLRVIKLKDVREAIAAGGEAMSGITKYLDMMRRFQGVEGLTILDAQDEFVAHTHGAFSGLAEALVQFGQQLSGALQIPLVRLFGQSPAGLNSTGQSDLITYYDGIKQQQERQLRNSLDGLFRIIARSEGINLPKNFNFEFKSLWQMTPEQKSQIAAQRTQSVIEAFSAGVIDQVAALRELRQIGRDTGTFTNVTDAMIEEAIAQPPPNAMESLGFDPDQVPGNEGQQPQAPLPGVQTQPSLRRVV